MYRKVDLQQQESTTGQRVSLPPQDTQATYLHDELWPVDVSERYKLVTAYLNVPRPEIPMPDFDVPYAAPMVERVI